MHTDDGDSKKGLFGGFGVGHQATAGGLLSALGSTDFFGKRRIDGLYFNNKRIALDGYSFNGCRFDNCTLFVTTSNFDISVCVIDASCTIEYGGEIAKIIQLFNSRFPQAYNFFAPPFVPLKNPDGSITITSGQ